MFASAKPNLRSRDCRGRQREAAEKKYKKIALRRENLTRDCQELAVPLYQVMPYLSQTS